MTIVISGDNGITFPNSTVQASSGVVLQVVQGISSTQVLTSSTSYVTTGLSASITPKFATSKILILVSLPTANQGISTSAFFTIYKGSTNLASNVFNAFVQSYGSASTIYNSQIMNFLDSPATTSSTTYSVYMQAYSAQNLAAMINSTIGTITLMEIAG
jgi:hypothetical protein